MNTNRAKCWPSITPSVISDPTSFSVHVNFKYRPNQRGKPNKLVFSPVITKYAVWFSAKGRMDMIGIVRSVSRKEMTRFNIWLVEQTARVIQQENDKYEHRNVEAKQTFLFDLDGFSLRHVAYRPGKPFS